MKHLHQITLGATVACLAIVALFSSCVTAADLYEISDAVHELEIGEATTQETAERIDTRIGVVEKRTRALTDPSSLPKTPGEWAAYLLSLGVMGGASAVGVNRYRNGQRKKRGEKVSTPD